MPNKELLRENILITCTEKSGWVDIDLSKYNLVYSKDIVLSLEWVRVDGVNKNRLIHMNGSKQKSANVLFNIKRKKGVLFVRKGVEAKWVKIDDESPSFYVTVRE